MLPTTSLFDDAAGCAFNRSRLSPSSPLESAKYPPSLHILHLDHEAGEGALFLGLAAAIAGLRPASGQDCDDCTGLPATPPAECDEAELARAVCCAQADVDAASADVEAATAALATAQAALVEAEGILDDAEGIRDAAEMASDICQGGGGDWVPTIGQTWNYHLNAADGRPEDIDQFEEVDVFMIDMDGPLSGCDNNGNNCVEDEDVVPATIAAIHGAGKYVVCYINIGTYEPWRLDKGEFTEIGPGILGNTLPEWEDEQWVDVTFTLDGADEPAVYQIMRNRVAKAASLGCDGIEPDNMDVGYVSTLSDTGVTVSKQQTIDYARWFANYVHTETSMKVAMKNLVWTDPDGGLAELATEFDFAINEECARWSECDLLKSWFIPYDKPVFHVEYRGYDSDNKRKSHIKNFCNGSPDEFSNILKTYPVYGPFCTCDSSDNYYDTWICTRALNRNWS